MVAAAALVTTAAHARKSEPHDEATTYASRHADEREEADHRHGDGRVDGGTGASGCNEKNGSAQDAPLQEDCDAPYQPSGIWRYQPQAEELYTHLWTQTGVAILIGMNFLMNIVSKEIDPMGTEYVMFWQILEDFFNIVFMLELALNMYGTWFFRFWRSGWNVFDFIVVGVGIIDTLRIDLPSPLKMLRMMRAFRVFRLFAKIKSLNKIVVSLAHAVPGMSNAMMINVLVMCIYAVVGVEFFEGGGGCLQPNRTLGFGPASLTTARGGCYGEEYFGAFGKSMYTLFQVLTGESWSEAIVRPLIWSYNTPMEQFGTAFFFVSFIVVNAIVLLNVVVAVLLEKMATDEDADAQQAQDASQIGSDMSILMEEMSSIKDSVRDCRADMESMQSQINKLVDLLENAKQLRVSV
eukprot:TRINITY_DN22351_c0_g4_i2.p1 TRINITY_DN22351_c0_g4~~TRINITY_DN22351_c0_g4_i2.p1  ORF type:complete len:408 (-),score=119.33 TRINITY_DN22351_c0_g4_i2:45-1268(-)